MPFFFGILAVVALLVLGLVFTASIRATALVFLPMVALGALVIFYHFRKGGKGHERGDAVFTDDHDQHHQDRAA